MLYRKLAFLLIPGLLLATPRPHIDNNMETIDISDKDDDTIAKYLWDNEEIQIKKRLPKLKDPVLDKFREVIQLGTPLEKTIDDRLKEEELKFKFKELKLKEKMLEEDRLKRIKDAEEKARREREAKIESMQSLKKYKNDMRRYMITEKELSERFLLPEPVSKILIGNKVVVYAVYYVPVVTSNSVIDYTEEPISPRNITQSNIKNLSMNAPSYTQANKWSVTNKFAYKPKKIKLTLGNSFGHWKVSRITNNFVEYKNQQTDEKIRKYY